MKTSIPRFIQKKNCSVLNTQSQYHQLRALWMLRILVFTKAYNEFFSQDGFEEENVMGIMGLKPIKRKKCSKKIVLTRLQSELKKYEKKDQANFHQCTLYKNIKMLEQVMDLSEVQEDILALFAMVKNEDVMDSALDHLGDLNSTALIKCLCKILGYRHDIVSKNLRKESILLSSGLIKLDKGLNYFSRKLELLDGFEDLLLKENKGPDEILESFFKISKRSQLTSKDFLHLKKDLDILIPVLESAVKEKIEGVNILIYGIPGTGKTEIAKVITKALKMQLYEINVEDRDGDPISGQVRFRAYQLCQSLLQKSNGIVMFDEIEDVFPSVPSFFFGPSRSEINKGWINNILETNKTPAIWISNCVHQIDPAYLRRFDYVLEIKTPPRNVRKKIIKNHLSEFQFNDIYLTFLSQNEAITPALVSKTAKIAKLAVPKCKLSSEAVIEQVINRDFEIMGISKKINRRSTEKIKYDLRYLNADTNLRELISGLKRTPYGRIALFGSPGTGKTAFVKHVAEKLNKPLIEKRGSDLLDKFVGGTEANIAGMFKQAISENAILLLDEADSFLRDRTSAQRSWEVTQVNELLVQMENFEGIFFCSTNHMDNFDTASIRRFDFKIKFDVMGFDQTWRMFLQAVKEFGNPIENKLLNILKQKLRSLNNLTPGDFAIIKRQSRFKQEKMTVSELMHILEKESLMKGENHSNTIGFSRQ